MTRPGSVPDLPIHETRDALLAAWDRCRRILVHAPTGSGKSTQVPQMLLDAGRLGDGQILILQPRRIAARLLAARVAYERGVTLGGEVGYQIRMDDVSGRNTRIKFVTEGLLLRLLLSNPTLKGVSAVVLDEFHERHVHGDVSLARLCEVQRESRPDLGLLVMSATLDRGLLETYLAPCEVVSSEGRTFPVDIRYVDKPVDHAHYPIWEAVADELESLVTEQEGDVLVFMPGAYEISRTIEAIRHSRAGRGALVLPLHGEMPASDQDAAVARYDQRKIIVATNVAETSLTIDGIRIVVDAGLARVAKADPRRGINTLLIEKISRASADQRAGRGGRTAPGVCLRLWTEREHHGRPTHDIPEIHRVDLAETLLNLKAGGVGDLATFPWVEPPEPKSLEHAVTVLTDLGALAEDGSLTDIGARMAAFPTHPRYSRMLLAANERGCVRAAALIAALTGGRDILIRNPGRGVESDRTDVLGESAASDFLLLMRAWRYAEKSGFDARKCARLGIHAGAAREVRMLYERFLSLAERQGLDVSDAPATDEALQKTVLMGFADHVARRADEGSLRCLLVHKRTGVLARASAVQHSPLLVVSEIREIGRGDGEVDTVLSLATAVEREWLQELFPRDFTTGRRVRYDEFAKRVVCEETVCFRDLVLETSGKAQPPPDEAAQLLAAEVLAGRIAIKAWDDAVEQWIVRVNRVGEWFPEMELPRIAGAELRSVIEHLCHGAVSAKDVKEREVWPVLRSWLSHAQLSFVEAQAPERFKLPGGKSAKIRYAAEGEPVLSARIQELYGVTGSLSIASGRAPLVIEVLAPSYKPVQKTSSLETFWRESYPKLKQELQRKYPKHEWR